MEVIISPFVVSLFFVMHTWHMLLTGYRHFCRFTLCLRTGVLMGFFINQVIKSGRYTLSFFCAKTINTLKASTHHTSGALSLPKHWHSCLVLLRELMSSCCLATSSSRAEPLPKSFPQRQTHVVFSPLCTAFRHW